MMTGDPIRMGVTVDYGNLRNTAHTVKEFLRHYYTNNPESDVVDIYANKSSELYALPVKHSLHTNLKSAGFTFVTYATRNRIWPKYDISQDFTGDMVYWLGASELELTYHE